MSADLVRMIGLAVILGVWTFPVAMIAWSLRNEPSVTREVIHEGFEALPDGSERVEITDVRTDVR